MLHRCERESPLNPPSSLEDEGHQPVRSRHTLDDDFFAAALQRSFNRVLEGILSNHSINSLHNRTRDHACYAQCFMDPQSDS
jgi:hypothetical protein